jgi:hypothetical protein
MEGHEIYFMFVFWKVIIEKREWELGRLANLKFEIRFTHINPF